MFLPWWWIVVSVIEALKSSARNWTLKVSEIARMFFTEEGAFAAANDETSRKRESEGTVR